MLDLIRRVRDRGLSVVLISYDMPHVPVLQRQTVARVLQGSAATVDQFGHNLRLVFPFRSIATLRERPEEEWSLVHHALMIYVLFPNTVMIMASDHLETWRIFPGPHPAESVIQVSLYTPEAAATDGTRVEWQRRLELLLGTVNDEDFPVVEDVQRALTTGAQTHLTFGRHEPALAHFHRAVGEELHRDERRGAGLPVAPLRPFTAPTTPPPTAPRSHIRGSAHTPAPPDPTPRCSSPMAHGRSTAASRGAAGSGG